MRRAKSLGIMGISVAMVIAVGALYQHKTNAGVHQPLDSDALYTHSANTNGRLFARDIAEIVEQARADKASPELHRKAAQLARRAIDQSRASGDPRMLGRAQAALEPWWNDAEPPNQVMLLRAIIRQSLHEFEAALRDLDLYVQKVPDDPQGWLTRAVVLTVRGEAMRAEESCLPVRNLAPGIYAATCIAGAKCISGRSQDGIWGIESALAASRRSTSDELAWAHTTEAECAARLGDDARAEKLLREVLAKDESDSYARATLADILLDTDRPKEASDLVRAFESNDNLLLRLVIAEKRAHLPHFKEAARELRTRYDASHLRGDALHLREEARFALVIDEEPKIAVDLAKRNWLVQKETADLRILWESGVAAKDASALATVRDWMNRSKLEDPKIRYWLSGAGAEGKTP